MLEFMVGNNESTGGHYIPALASHLISMFALAQYRGQATPRIPPLTGIAIGDGLVNPLVQVHHLLNFPSR